MVGTIGFMVFGGALVVSCWAIAAMIAPQWQRIVRLAAGQPELSFAPLATLAQAERRIAARRWASTGATAPVSRWRAAA